MASILGRPTKYKEKYCKIVIEKMKEGAAMEELPLYLNCCLDTIYEWKKVHPIFSEAIKIGLSFSKAKWMNWGRQELYGKDFNSTLWYMNMKNRFGWADKQESTHQTTLKLDETSLKAQENLEQYDKSK